MYIHNYQIHNVLNVYQRQLTQELASGKQKPVAKSKSNSQFLYKRNRQTVIEKVASNVLEKIDLLNSGTQPNIKLENLSKHEPLNEKNIDQKKIKEFSFNVINQNNQKIASSISVDNTEGLIYNPNATIYGEQQNNQTATSEKSIANNTENSNSNLLSIKV